MLLRSAAIALSLIAAPLHADDWRQFRGPNGTGTVTKDAPPLPDLEKNLLWKVDVPGSGHSSPIVVGDKIFVQAANADASKVSLVCLGAKDGKVEWTKSIDSKPGKTHRLNTMASSTPCSDGERVFAAFWDGSTVSLHGYELDGKELWSKPLGSFTSEHGMGHSPMVADGRVYFNFDQDGAAEIFAFDAKTGDELWKQTRKAHRCSYTVPIVVERGKAKELVVGTTTTIDGYDPATGKPNWSFELPWEKNAKMLRAVGVPIEAAGRIVVYTGEGGSGRYMVALKPGEKTAERGWELKKGTPYVPGILAFGAELYWVADDGIASCAEAATGKVLWSERLLAKGVSASPILLKDTVLAIGEDGKFAAFAASPKGLDTTANGKLGEAVFATPAAANGKLYIRGAKHLFCFGKK